MLISSLGGVVEDTCLWSICFYRLTGNEPRFFGFAELLAALALMVLAWTSTDARYRFRVRTAPLPMPRLTFWVVLTVGLLTLLTDVWRAEKWYVPRGTLITPGEWQAVLGAVLLLAFLTWIWFAFMRPPRVVQAASRGALGRAHLATASAGGEREPIRAAAAGQNEPLRQVRRLVSVTQTIIPGPARWRECAKPWVMR